MPLALSIHNFISSVGADAGFASIIGLAVLVLLYFAHARETANLHDEASFLSQRLQEAEARLAQLTRQQQAAAAPVRSAQPVVAVAAAVPAAAMPFAPAGVGGPALAAATRVVPVATVAPGPQPASAAAAGAMPAAAIPSAAAPAAAPATATPSPASAVPSSAAPGPVAPAASPAPAAGQPSSPAVAVPAPATVAGANGAAQSPPAPLAAPPPPRAQVRATPAASAIRRPPPPRLGAERKSYRGRFAMLFGALVAVAAVAALLIVTSGGGSQNKPSTPRTTNAAAAHRSRPAAVFNPATVTVAVLNGTSTYHLAHNVAARLTAVGFKQGAIETAADQSMTSTIVGYLPSYRSDALRVASALNLRQSAVRPVDQAAQTVACPPPSRCTANVIVTVGSDLATI